MDCKNDNLGKFIKFSCFFVKVGTSETITNHVSLSSPPNTYQALVKGDKYLNIISILLSPLPLF